MTHTPGHGRAEQAARIAAKPWYRQLYVQVLVAIVIGIVLGNAVATLSVAKWENGLDLERARAVLAGKVGEPSLAAEPEAEPAARAEPLVVLDMTSLPGNPRGAPYTFLPTHSEKNRWTANEFPNRTRGETELSSRLGSGQTKEIDRVFLHYPGTRSYGG